MNTEHREAAAVTESHDHDSHDGGHHVNYFKIYVDPGRAVLDQRGRAGARASVR